MIEHLGDWLKTLIFIILIATFVDLLLPNQYMQRYVKVVVSLIILLAMLNPVVSFLKGRDSVDRELRTLQSEWAAEGTDAGGPTLNQILNDAKIMRTSDMASYQDLVRSEVETAVKQDLEDRADVTVESVKASMTFGQDPGLTGLDVKVRPKTAGEPGATAGGSGRSDKPEHDGIEVPAVKPIRILTPDDAASAPRQDAGKAESGEDAQAPAKRGTAASGTRTAAKRVLAELEQEFRLHADQIKVTVDGS